MVALQVAALQQQLMVAALTCDDISLYNSFVITYQKDLVTSDETLQAFFNRFGEEDGSSAYHAFKTKMANMYSQRSAADKRRFCATAHASFGPALQTEKVSLASFALSQPSFVDEPYTNCGTSVAGGAMLARTPAPASNVLTAANAAAEDKPLSAALKDKPAPAAAAAGSAAVATAGANSPAPSSSQAVNPNSNPQRDAARPAENRYGYPGQGSASQAYRERLAQQRATQQRAAQQRAAEQRAAQAARSRYRDPYDARGYFWPADRYWQYCYTRYGERLTCAEAAQRFRSNQFYYRAPYDPWGYSSGR
jgi:hypothetical protein